MAKQMKAIIVNLWNYHKTNLSNMFKFVVLFALVAVAAAVGSEEAHAEIEKQYSDVRADGFDYAVETSNGIYHKATGDEHGNIHGEYHYISHEGHPVKVTYVADEYGYQPESDVLPTPPPTPEAILKALDYIRAHPSKEEYHH